MKKIRDKGWADLYGSTTQVNTHYTAWVESYDFLYSTKDVAAGIDENNDPKVIKRVEEFEAQLRALQIALGIVPSNSVIIETEESK